MQATGDGDLSEGVRVDEAHHDAVPITVDGLGDGEARLPEDLHESKFLLGRQVRKVEPIGKLAMLVIVPLLLDLAKGGAAKPVHLHDQCLLLTVVKCDEDV